MLGGVWGWGFADEDVWLLRTDQQGRLRGCARDFMPKYTLAAPALALLPGIAQLRPAAAIPKDTAFQASPGAASELDRCP